MTQETKHTPAPWELRRSDSNANYFLYSENKKRTPFCGVNYHPPEGDGLANAHLIAAAPEMLKALERLVDLMDGNMSVPQYVYDAINKAKGIK